MLAQSSLKAARYVSAAAATAFALRLAAPQAGFGQVS